MPFAIANDDAEVRDDENGASDDEDPTPEAEEELSTGGDDVLMQSIDEADLPDIYNNTAASRDQESDDDMSVDSGEDEAENVPDASEIADNSQDEEDDDDDDVYWKGPRPRNTSFVHHIHLKNKHVFISFDIETGGEYCGIIQLSAKIIRMTCNNMDDTDGNWLYKQHKTKKWVTVAGPTFNKYVYPGEKAIWNEDVNKDVHGLHAEHEEIKRAKENGQDMKTVWIEFCRWIEDNTKSDEIATLVAYNGETCDLRWIWRHTQAPNAPGRFPSRVKFFMDPLSVIKSYTSCELNKSKSNLDSLELGYVWKHLNPDTSYPGDLHNSLVDVELQCDIISHKVFAPHINRSSSVRSIHEIFSAAEKRNMENELEPQRPVHHGWTEITHTNNKTWEPNRQCSYSGSQGGGPAGPSNEVMTKAREIMVNGGDLSDLYLMVLPYDGFFNNLAAKQTKVYTEEFVIEKQVKDRDGNPKKKPMLQVCDENTPNARRRNSNEKKKYKITAGYVMTWHAITIILGGHLGSDKGDIRRAWMKAPRGLSFRYIKNAMTRDAFEYMKRFLHFADNSTRKGRDEEGYDPLFKVTPALEFIMKGIRRAWSPGQRITIDESMVKYMGRAIKFIQYMPAKPIKHGIKIFCVCCAESGVLLGFEVYCGQERKDWDNTAIAIVERLIEDAELTQAKGRILFTDNWYTSTKLAMLLFRKYKWTFCGTIVPTKKKTRAAYDIPFLKLSNSARKKLYRGWFREAVVDFKAGRTTCRMQCTTWKDQRRVVFLHTDRVTASPPDNNVRRHRRGEETRDIIRAPLSQGRYAESMGAVDNMDHDCAYYSTSLKTNRYWLRIYFWAHDRVQQAVYQIAIALAEAEVGPAKWKKYKDDRAGFQIDLGMDVLNRGIKLSFGELEDGEERPDFMRKTPFVPCDCDECYHCMNGHTNGIAHADRMIVEYGDSSGNKRKHVVTECDEERMSIERLQKGQKCQVCMDALKISHPQLKYGDRRNLARTSTKGCRLCDQPVCEICWPNYEHRHKKRKK
jgi:hypothetical protein